MQLGSSWHMSAERSRFLSPFARQLMLIVMLYATWGTETWLFHLCIRRPWPADIVWRHTMLRDAARLQRNVSPLSPKNIAICLGHRRVLVGRLAAQCQACVWLLDDLMMMCYQLFYVGGEISEFTDRRCLWDVWGKTRNAYSIDFWWWKLKETDFSK